jgi:hypothetical protein
MTRKKLADCSVVSSFELNVIDRHDLFPLSLVVRLVFLSLDDCAVGFTETVRHDDKRTVVVVEPADVRKKSSTVVPLGQCVQVFSNLLAIVAVNGIKEIPE